MFRKLVALLSAAALTLGLMAASVAPVGATGDCSKYVIFYKDGNFSGASVKMCYGVNDNDFRNGLGPDANGVTHTGWNNQISSFKVRGTSGTDAGVCLFRDELYVSEWHASKASEDWNVDIFNNDETGSFRWGPISPLNGRASC